LLRFVDYKGNGGQQKTVTGPLHLIGAGNKKHVIGPLQLDRMVGNKNTLPTLHLIGGQQKHVTGPLQLDRMVGNKNTLPAPYNWIEWWATKTRYPPYI